MALRMGTRITPRVTGASRPGLRWASWSKKTGRGTGSGHRAAFPLRCYEKSSSLPARSSGARLYVSGIGWSEAYLNGDKVSDRVLDPCASEYAKSVYYVVHDVTEQLERGANAIGLWLGNGWYSEPESSGRWATRYGDSPRAMVQLNIELVDGKTVRIASDETWKATGSCITQNDFYYGERYDARLESPGWSEPGFDDTGWTPAEQKSAPGGVLRAQTCRRFASIGPSNHGASPSPGPGPMSTTSASFLGDGSGCASRVRPAPRSQSSTRRRIYAESGLVDKRQHEAPRATDYYILRGDPRGGDLRTALHLSSRALCTD